MKIARQRQAPPCFGALSIFAAVVAGLRAAAHDWEQFAFLLAASIVLFLIAWWMTVEPSEEELEAERDRIDASIERLRSRRP